VAGGARSARGARDRIGGGEIARGERIAGATRGEDHEEENCEKLRHGKPLWYTWIMPYSWLTLDDGRTEVVVAPGKSEIIVLDEHDAIACMRAMERWVDLGEQHGARVGLPTAWILGVIWAESNGNPAARSADGGRGLMQLTHPSLTTGLSDAEVMKPETNVRIGSDLLARLSRRSDGEPNGLPTLASLYNAGGLTGNIPHPSETNPWGMRCTTGYIDRVVRSANVMVPWLEGGACRLFGTDNPVKMGSR
jgi:hypothetical protein